MIHEDLLTLHADDVIAAYKETGIAPGTGRFIYEFADCMYGCALGVVGLHKGIDLRNQEIHKALPLLPDGWLSFALGFDDGVTAFDPDPDPQQSDHPEHYTHGYNIGKAVLEWWESRERS